MMTKQCPKCGYILEINPAVEMGKMTSKKKKKSSRENGKLSHGRPRLFIEIDSGIYKGPDDQLYCKIGKTRNYRLLQPKTDNIDQSSI